MTDSFSSVARGLSAFTDAQAALDRICDIYQAGAGALRQKFDAFLADGSDTEGEAPCYPYVGIAIDPQEVSQGGEMSYGKLPGAGTFGTTATRPDMFRDYYREQLQLLLDNYDKPIWVGTSRQPIPLSFVIEEATADLTPERVQALRGRFPLPELSRIDDAIANGTYAPPPESTTRWFASSITRRPRRNTFSVSCCSPITSAMSTSSSPTAGIRSRTAATISRSWNRATW